MRKRGIDLEQAGCERSHVDRLGSVSVAGGEEQRNPADWSNEEIQYYFTHAVKAYVKRMEEQDEVFSPFLAGEEMTATEVTVSVSEMLRAVNVQLFELGMWQAWTGRI